jgi:hypothetical protein
MALDMTVGDLIQSLILVVLVRSVFVLARQTRLQNRIFRAQLLRDRFEMYWKLYDPVSDAQIEEFKLYPEDYMTRERFDQFYKGQDVKIRKYIYFSMLYEYLAFTHILKDLKVPDPLGENWVDMYVAQLCQVSEFQDVHEEYRGYYPTFEKVVDHAIEKATTGKTNIALPLEPASQSGSAKAE